MTAQSKTVGGVLVALLLAAAAGYGVARLTAPAPPTAAPEAESPTAAQTLTLDAAAIKGSNIGVEPASTAGFDSEVLAPATVAAAPDGQAVLTAHADGAVVRILKRLGDPVKAGETVALVESREAAAMAADRSAAAARATAARQKLAREQSLFDQRVSPRQDVEAAQADAAAAAAELRRADAAMDAARVAADGRSVVVASPIAGRIISAPAALGAFVHAETELFRVADPTRIQIEASVPAGEARLIQPGDTAVVETAAGEIPATVRAVTPSLDAATRTAGVVLSLSRLDGVTAGQLVRVRIKPRGAAGSPGVVIPDEAVQSVEGKTAVFIRTPTGFRVQPVTVGRRAAGRAEILQGLKPGEPVATRNAFLLKAEATKGAGDDE